MALKRFRDADGVVSTVTLLSFTAKMEQIVFVPPPVLISKFLDAHTHTHTNVGVHAQSNSLSSCWEK